MKTLIFLSVLLLALSCSKEDEQSDIYENVKIKVSVKRLNNNASGKTYIEHYIRATSTLYAWDKDTIKIGHTSYTKSTMPELGKDVSIKVNPVNDSVLVEYFYYDKTDGLDNFISAKSMKVKTNTTISVKTKAGAPYLSFE